MAISNKPVAIVLGGTNPHIALVQNIQKRGYHVILLDYLDNPPAKQFADRHVQISTLDSDAVLRLAKNEDASLVISTCIDQANVTACKVSQELGLPVPYPYETAKRLSSKIEIKRFMREMNIPSSPFITCNGGSGPQLKELRFPVVVKPTDCTGSKGVVKVGSPVDLNHILKKALELSRSSMAIIEEHVPGTEVQVDFLVNNSKARIILTREKVKAQTGKGGIEQTLGSLIPAELDAQHMDQFAEIGQNIANGFKLKNTPLFLQAIVNEGGINVIEFAARIGGGLSVRIVELATGFDFLDAAVSAVFANNVTHMSIKQEHQYASRIIYAEPCTFGSVAGTDELLNDGTIIECHQFHQTGSIIGEELTSRNRIAAFIVSGDTKDEIMQKIHRAEKKLRIFDYIGNEVSRRDLS